MRSGEAAKILGVDRNTIYNWTQNPDLSRFFSSSARMEDGSAQRILTQSDLLVLNTIRTKRGQGIFDWKEIAAVLESGERFQEFPQNAISGDPRTVPVYQAEQSVKAMATLTERDQILENFAKAEKEIARRQEIEEQLRAQVAELQERLGKIEGKTIREERDSREIALLEMAKEKLNLVREYEAKLSDLRAKLYELERRQEEKKSDG